jgi:hypothetical protein
MGRYCAESSVHYDKSVCIDIPTEDRVSTIYSIPIAYHILPVLVYEFFVKKTNLRYLHKIFIFFQKGKHWNLCKSEIDS